MEFPYTFFEDEVRDGFYVSGAVKRTWAAQLEVLEEIDRACKLHGITWYMDFGTLLGAVRHGGFVPWDDDIDICMLRADYDRFLEIAAESLPEGYEVLSMHGKEEVYYEYWARITNGHRLNFDNEYLKKYHECPYAVGIDVFPLDYIASDSEKEKKRCELALACMQIANAVSEDAGEADGLKEELAIIEKLCGVKFDGAKPLRQQLYEVVDRLFCLYGAEEASEVASMIFYVAGVRAKFPLACYKDTVMLPFETTELPAPQGYREILEIRYGDYMKRVRGGGAHDYPLFRDQEEVLINLVPEYPFQYQFDKDDLKNENRLPQRKLKRQAERFIRVIAQAHKTMEDLLREENYGNCDNLLETCQKQAIDLGTSIEEYYGEGYVTVKLLEEYCELLYDIYQMTEDASGFDKEQVINVVQIQLAELWKRISESVRRNVTERKEIVFLPFKASAWDTLEDIWRAASEDENCDVYVLPIPYYERDARGVPGALHYEGKDFPKYISVMDYKTYDFRERHPDVIIIQNPYDGCNYTTSVSPEFYAQNLKRYTENLIYVPWFVMDEIEDNDEKSKYTMRYFCTVPGLVHADKTFVQSERMRNRYIDCLTEFAGEDTRQIWEKKIADGATVKLALFS